MYEDKKPFEELINDTREIGRLLGSDVGNYG